MPLNSLRAGGCRPVSIWFSIRVNEFTNSYDLRWMAPQETAYPSTFLISPDGTVFFSRISKQHGGRTTAAEVLDVLKRQNSKAATGHK